MCWTQDSRVSHRLGRGCLLSQMVYAEDFGDRFPETASGSRPSFFFAYPSCIQHSLILIFAVGLFCQDDALRPCSLLWPHHPEQAQNSCLLDIRERNEPDEMLQEAQMNMLITEAWVLRRHRTSRSMSLPGVSNISVRLEFHRQQALSTSLTSKFLIKFWNCWAD